MFPTKVVDGKKKHISCSIILFFENLAIYVIMWEKYSRVEQATDDITAHAVCFLDNEGYRHNSKWVMFIALPLRQILMAMLVTSVLYV